MRMSPKAGDEDWLDEISYVLACPDEPVTDGLGPVSAGPGAPLTTTSRDAATEPGPTPVGPGTPTGSDAAGSGSASDSAPAPGQAADFAAGGPADAMAPGPVLATLVDLVQRAGLGRLDDDELTGVLQAASRLAAWSASVRVAAVSGLAARREQEGQESGDWRPLDHVGDEVAVALTLTRRSAARLLDLALGLDRLPLTRAALAAGLIDERRAQVITDELTGLDDAHAAAVEKLLIGRAPGLTSGQLRALARRLVLSADPAAARRRKEAALHDARVELSPETAGTAALAGRDLPPAAALAADKHLTALAQALKAAGTRGTLDTLRARAYLHLLSGQPAATLIPPATRPGHSPRTGTGTDIPSAPGPTARGGPAPGGAPPGPGGLRGTVHLTMPLTAWLGWTQSPGHVPGYGPVDADDARALATLLTYDPATQWCLTLTSPAGHPLAHACAPHGPPGPPPQPATPQHPGPAGTSPPGDHPSPAQPSPPGTQHPPDPAAPPAPALPDPARPDPGPAHPAAPPPSPSRAGWQA